MGGQVKLWNLIESNSKRMIERLDWTGLDCTVLYCTDLAHGAAGLECGGRGLLLVVGVVALLLLQLGLLLSRLLLGLDLLVTAGHV